MATVHSRPFAPDEQPAFLGSPYGPVQSTARRIGYAVIGLVLASMVNFGNGLVSAHLATLSGSADEYVSATSLLIGVFIAFNASANLVLVKARAQFGIPRVTRILLYAYGATAVVQLLLPGLASALVARAAAGLAAAGLVTLSVYYMMQSLPAKLKPLGLVVAIGAVQFGTPLGRLVPVELFAADGWRTLALMELAVALVALTAITAHPLPPSERGRMFEPLDLFTYALVLAANLLLCLTLAEGRLLWWTDTPWLGWALAACIPLYAVALSIELSRRNPLLRLGWVSTPTILRFAAVALVVRLALSEQSYGAVGLLTVGGLNNDQLHTLFGWVLVAQALGIVVAVATLGERRPPYQVMAAALVIALGAWLDTGATNVTRAPQLFFSQSLIAFGTTLFIGPALVYGASKMLARGADHLVTFVVLFSTTQNIGGLAGSALLGSYQVARARYHAAALADHLAGADPQVVARIQAGAAALGGAVTDPAQRGAQGAGLLGQALGREAAVLAFNDAFALVAVVALAAAAYLAGVILVARWRERHRTSGKGQG